MIQLPNNHIGVEVPESDCRDYEIIRDQDNYDQQQIKYPSDTYYGLQNYSWQNIPSGQWSIVGLSDELTEEQWKGIVEWREEYKDRVTIAKDYVTGKAVFSATASGLSLLKSLGHSRLLILKLK